MDRTVATPNGSLPHMTAYVAPLFEQQLSANGKFAMAEASKYFDSKGSVHETVQRISRRLDELNIPFVVVGGIAMFHHGYRRFTEDVDILVTSEDLDVINERLDGLGFVRPFSTSRKCLRDTVNGVRIEFLTTGEFPGDGKPKPIAFPDPRDVYEIRDGIKVLKLPRLIELKLASFMTGKARSKDLGDVEELIRVLNLPRDFAGQLNLYVSALFLEKWDEVHS